MRVFGTQKEPIDSALTQPRLLKTNLFYLVHRDHHSDVEPFPSVFLSPLRDFAVSVQAAAKDNKIITENK